MTISYRKVAYFLVSLAAAWIAIVSAAILIYGSLERSDLDGPIEIGWVIVDNALRYLDSVSRSEFSPIEFLSFEFWSLYLTIFLASLGAFGGFLKLYQGIDAQPQKNFSAERRQNMLLLVGAIAASAILGSSAVLASVRKKYLLGKFYSLEVHLVRFEGLMFNSLAISANPNLLDTFFVYMLVILPESKHY